MLKTSRAVVPTGRVLGAVPTSYIGARCTWRCAFYRRGDAFPISAGRALRAAEYDGDVFLRIRVRVQATDNPHDDVHDHNDDSGFDDDRATGPNYYLRSWSSGSVARAG